MASSSNQQQLVFRKRPNVDALFFDVIKKTRCDDDAVQMYFNEVAKKADDYEDSEATSGTVPATNISSFNNESILSPPKCLLKRTAQPSSPDPLRPFKFEKVDEKNALLLRANIRDSNNNTNQSCNGLAIAFDDDYALVALEIADSYTPATCAVGALPTETITHLKAKINQNNLGDNLLSEAYGECVRNGKAAYCILDGPGKARTVDNDMRLSLLNGRIRYDDNDNNNNKKKKTNITFRFYTQNFSSGIQLVKKDIRSISRDGVFVERTKKPKLVLDLARLGKLYFAKTCYSFSAVLKALETDLDVNHQPTSHEIALQQCLGGETEPLVSKGSFLPCKVQIDRKEKEGLLVWHETPCSCDARVESNLEHTKTIKTIFKSRKKRHDRKEKERRARGKG